MRFASCIIIVPIIPTLNEFFNYQNSYKITSMIVNNEVYDFPLAYTFYLHI